MSKQIKIEIPELDTDSGLGLCDGDTGIYLHSLRLFASNMPATLEKLRSVTEEKLSDYAISVHGIKGMSQYIGAETARETAKKLEFLAKDGNFKGVLAENEAFIKYVEKIINGIKNWLEKHGEISK
jgi:HPt (histidine-containing phosphotransfer) domain-containing protein